jgi:hypothetical protein
MLFRMFKNCIWCSRMAYKMLTQERPFVSPNELPWLWIGAELVDGTIVDLTDNINKQIRLGDFVDVDYLESRSGYGNANWLYLDPVTIKQVEFPAKGFVIGLNDSAE